MRTGGLLCTGAGNECGSSWLIDVAGTFGAIFLVSFTLTSRLTSVEIGQTRKQFLFKAMKLGELFLNRRKLLHIGSAKNQRGLFPCTSLGLLGHQILEVRKRKAHGLELGDPADSFYRIAVVEAIASRCALHRLEQPHILVKMDSAHCFASRFREFTDLKKLGQLALNLTGLRRFFLTIRSNPIIQAQGGRTRILTGRGSRTLNDGKMSVTCGRFFFATRHAKSLGSSVTDSRPRADEDGDIS